MTKAKRIEQLKTAVQNLEWALEDLAADPSSDLESVKKAVSAYQTNLSDAKEKLRKLEGPI